MMEIHDMTDAELVRAVAVEVMGWYTIEDSTGYAFNGRRICYGDSDWSPLTDWNDAMQVRKAMQARGCSVSLIDHDSFSGEVRAGEDVYVDCTPETDQRALLEAALAAVRKGGE